MKIETETSISVLQRNILRLKKELNYCRNDKKDEKSQLILKVERAAHLRQKNDLQKQIKQVENCLNS